MVCHLVVSHEGSQACEGLPTSAPHTKQQSVACSEKKRERSEC